MKFLILGYNGTDDDKIARKMNQP